MTLAELELGGLMAEDPSPLTDGNRRPRCKDAASASSESLPAMEYDASTLRRTSDAEDVPWRARDVTLIWVSQAGRITQAQGIEEKRRVLHDAAAEDCLLLAWPGQWRQDIFFVDDRNAGLGALLPPSRG